MGRGNKEKGKNPIKLARKKKKKNAEGNSKGEDNDMINSETNDPASDVIEDNNAPSEGEDPTGTLTTASTRELQGGGEKTYNQGDEEQKNPLSDVSANLMKNKVSEKREDHFKDKSESYYASGREEVGTKVKCSNGNPQCDDPVKRNENRAGEEAQGKCVIQCTDGIATQEGGSLPEEGHEKNEEEPNRTTSKGCLGPSKEQTPNDYACSSAPDGEDPNIHPSDEENIPLDELLYETTERAKKYNRTNYGLMGILKVIRMTDPQLNMLALGTDLTTLGLNLNSPDYLFSSFTSPISEDPTYNEDYFVKPSCYLNTRFQIRLSLLLKLQTETLFYIFYNLPRDVLQAYAASELYLRKWTYHRNYKKWFFPKNLLHQGNLSSCRCWIYFDPVTWTKKMYNDFLCVKDMMHVQDITRCIEHIIQVQSNCSGNFAGPPNCGNPSQGASSQGEKSSPVGGAGTMGPQ
ncbi:NOT family protein [Plasmodium coatneyi]|uniref:NOT family protein n=1 Tax=Plasmodium coatneyi TaxID=208452 RepID=A0A1B1DZY5_9APIC|nr:NOT family protein [Plasmodium coatneyi]ANQ08342.1 NOT family protein [Plasmodium coatneyi]